MKLLDKKLVNAEVATQRKQQIDLGITLAKKVDVVKENLHEEEQRLDTFRTETVVKVRIEIDSLIRRKEVLKEEIQVALKRKAEALIPLESEWERLRAEQGRFSKEKDAWGEKSDSLKEREKQIERQEKEVEDEKSRTTNLKQRASEMLADAELTLSHARATAKELRMEADLLVKSGQERTKVVVLKEQEVEARESEVDRVWQKTRDKEVDIAIRERALKDKQETLLIESQRKHG